MLSMRRMWSSSSNNNKPNHNVKQSNRNIAYVIGAVAFTGLGLSYVMRMSYDSIAHTHPPFNPIHPTDTQLYRSIACFAR